MAVNRLALRVGLMCLAIQGFVNAHACAAELRELVSLVNDSSAKFRAVTADDVARAKATVRNHLAELSEVVGNGQDWRDYLFWDKQIQEFNRDENGTADFWRRVHARVARDTDLFEKGVFQKYRRVLQKLIRCIEAHDNPHLEGDFQAVLTELEEILSRSNDRLQPVDAARISELLTKLDRQQQAPELIESIRRHAMLPNLIIEIPAKLLASDQHFKEDFTVRQVVRGSPVEGTGTLEARQLASLDFGENAITVKSVVEGTSDSRSLGFGNRVTVQSSGSLQFESTSTVFINLEGVQTSGFNTTGTLSTQILGVSTNYTGRAAVRARQSAYSRQEADRQAAERQALADLDAAFSTRLEGLIAPLQATYRRNVYLPLLRHDRLPEKSKFVSDTEWATAQIWFADDVQLAAPSDPPWSEGAGEQLRLAIHESAVNNTSALLGGRVRSLVSVLNGKFFEYIAESAKPSERIDIRFHDEVAVRGILTDGSLELRLIGTEYIIDGATYPGMEIILRYHLEGETSTVLRLSEPPQVVSHVPDGAERSQFGLRGIALRRILSNLLEEYATDAFNLTEIMFPEPFDRLGKFQTQHLNIQDGWLIIEALPIVGAAGVD